MARQAKDGSFPGAEKRPHYGDLFSQSDAGVRGSWDWGQVDGALLASAVGVVTRRGDALSFATNRANTAGSVTVLTGGDRPRTYFNTYDEAEAWLARLAALASD